MKHLHIYLVSTAGHTMQFREVELGRSTVRSTHSRAAHIALAIGDATRFVVSARRCNFIISRRVDSDRDPGHKSVTNAVTKKHVLYKRIHVIGLRCQYVVFGIRSQCVFSAYGISPLEQ